MGLGRGGNETIRRQLLESVTRDIQDLLPHLETREREYEHDARTALGKRADAEAKAMREILDLQQPHLLATMSAHDKRHASLNTTNIYARANLETKRKALEKVDPSARPAKPPRWKREVELLEWLDSL